MAERTASPKSRDFYAMMAPAPALEPSFWALRKAGLETTRSRRRGFRYLGLRISAVLLGIGGSLGVYLGEKFLGAEVATLAALPLPAYGALALGTPALLELVRPEPPERTKKKRAWAWLPFLIGVVLLATWSEPGGQNQSTWLIPLAIYLVVSLGIRMWPRAKANNQKTPPRPGVPPQALGGAAPDKGPRRVFARREMLKPGPEQLLFARGWGLSEAIFWLFAVGVLPAFALQAFGFSGEAQGHDFLLMGLAILFAVGVSGVLGALGVLSERISPRFPRLVAFLILFAPFAVSLAIPQFPNLVNLILAANAYIASQATSHFGLI